MIPPVPTSTVAVDSMVSPVWIVAGLAGSDLFPSVERPPVFCSFEPSGSAWATFCCAAFLFARTSSNCFMAFSFAALISFKSFSSSLFVNMPFFFKPSSKRDAKSSINFWVSSRVKVEDSLVATLSMTALATIKDNSLASNDFSAWIVWLAKTTNKKRVVISLSFFIKSLASCCCVL